VRREARVEKYLIIERKQPALPPCITPVDEIKAWFTVRINRCLVKEAVDYRMNIMASYPMTLRGWSDIMCVLFAVLMMRIEQEWFVGLSGSGVFFRNHDSSDYKLKPPFPALSVGYM
jgi:hypothetical protein